MTVDQVTDEGFAREWAEWHRAQQARLTDPHGFLAVTGLYWLSETPTEFPGIPGLWSTGSDGPRVDLPQGADVVVDGVTVTGAHSFGVIPERGGVSVGWEEGVIEVARRGGRDLLRPRRADHPYLTSFPGTPTYPPDRRWRVSAHFVPYDSPRPVEVGAAVDGLRHVYEAPGFVEFELDGQTARLVVFPGFTENDYTALFTDATSGVTTCAANRTVLIEAPDAAGSTVIDFNRAVNLPCAYTDFATCPLPPAENRLPVAVEAGEKTPLGRVRGLLTDVGLVTEL